MNAPATPRPPTVQPLPAANRPGALTASTRPWSIVAAYAVFATLWIYFSDQALLLLLPDPQLLVRWSVFKGVGFVAITSLLLLVLMRRAFGQVESGYRALALAEQRLRDSEQELAGILHTASDAIVTVDEDSRIVRFNAAAERMFRCTGAEAAGRLVGGFVAGPLDATGSAPVVLQGVRADGTAFPVEASISAQAPGERVPRTVIVRDVTQRLAHEAEIERLNRLYAALREVNQAIVRADSRQGLLREVCRLLVEHGGFRMAWFGWNNPQTGDLIPMAVAGDHQGYLPNVTRHVDERNGERGPAATAFHENRPWICNDIGVDSGGSKWRAQAIRHGFHSVAALPVHQSGQPCGTLTVYAAQTDYFEEKEIALLAEATRDVSFALENLELEQERTRAHQRAESERTFSDTMIESMPGIVYFYDAAGHFLRWNRDFERMSGYGPDEIARMHPLDFFEGYERHAIEAAITEAFETGESQVQASLLTRDGRRMPHLFTGRRVLYNDMTCLVGVGIDISARLEAERNLRELNESLEMKVAERTTDLQAAMRRAESADRLKSAFLASMSHELRTPLNSIIGFTGILLQGLAGPLNDEQTRQLGMVQGSARHLLELINDVLDISKIEAGQFEIQSAPFDLPESIARVMETVRPQADRRGLGLAAEVAPELGTMTGDRRRVEQILLNLLNNAVKFTEHGGVTLHAQPATLDENGEERPGVCLRVVDTGIGIRQEDFDVLFQPFRQIDSGLTRAHEGTGLGLAICRRLAGLLGGSIDVRSQWAKGSEFSVTLPLDGSNAK